MLPTFFWKIKMYRVGHIQGPSNNTIILTAVVKSVNDSKCFKREGDVCHGTVHSNELCNQRTRLHESFLFFGTCANPSSPSKIRQRQTDKNIAVVRASVESSTQLHIPRTMAYISTIVAN